jgi:hypothetical protein
MATVTVATISSILLRFTPSTSPFSEVYASRSGAAIPQTLRPQTSPSRKLLQSLLPRAGSAQGAFCVSACQPAFSGVFQCEYRRKGLLAETCFSAYSPYLNRISTSRECCENGPLQHHLAPVSLSSLDVGYILGVF